MTEPEATRRYPPIAEYALLSDCHGAALVSREGSIDWCCLIRFDARPVFARLLDWDCGGYFRIAPESYRRATRRYLPDTKVLETRFEAGAGTLVLTDLLVVRSSDGHDGGTVRPAAEDRLVRRLECEGGPVRVRIEFVPRFTFGRTTPFLLADEGAILAYGGPDALILQGTMDLEIRNDHRADATVEIGPGEVLYLTLGYAPPHRMRVKTLDARALEERCAGTIEFWQNWLNRCTYQGEYAEAVHRSALTLKALTNVSTGAIVAAPTTSLPERIGGIRNWDYRYTWLRDATFVLDVLFLLGYRSEGADFMAWLHRTTAGLPEQLQIMYGEGGETLLPEIELDGVDGYRGSRPVRVGNAASRQFQLDIYGEVVQAAWRFNCHGGELGEHAWSLIAGLVEHVTGCWQKPDSGLWEVRKEPEHFVHSKVMAWVALDRGIRLAQALGKDCPDEWSVAREAIRARVMERGVRNGRFMRSFESNEPDAASLLFSLVGFIDADDPRMAATREWIEQELSRDGLVQRYRGGDGLPGEEGAFLICSFWLVQSLAQAGEVDRARELFERLLRLRNDLGLLSEQIDPSTGELLGNFPQAFSHIGLIDAALTLDEARRRASGPAPRSDSPSGGAIA